MTRARRVRYGSIYLVALAANLTFLFKLAPTPTGDEPHYLLYGLSIAEDGDLALGDDYGSHATVKKAYPHAELSMTTHAREFVDGEPLRSLHSPLLPALIAPVLALGGTWFDVRLVLAILTSLSIPILLSILDTLEGRRTRHVAVAVVVSASLPYIAYSSQIFPDALAAFLVLLGLRACLPRRGIWWRRGGFLALVLLPWLHVRYVPLAFGVAAGLALRDAASGAKSGHSGLRRLARCVPRVGLPLGLSLAGILAFNSWIYGQASFSAAYQGFPAGAPSLSVQKLTQYSFGDLFSRHYGILPLAPAYLVGLVGIGLAIRRWQWLALLAIAVVLSYYLPTTMIGLAGGYCPPGRFTVPVLVLLAIPLSLVAKAGRWVWAATAAGLLSLLVTLAALSSPSAALYPDDTGTWHVPLAKSFSRFFPTLLQPRFGDRALITPPQLSSELGPMTRSDNEVRAIGPADGYPGFFAFGPYIRLEPGAYIASFDVEVLSGSVKLEAVAGATRPPVTMQVPAAPRQPVHLSFSIRSGESLETRAFVSEPTTAKLFGVAVEPDPGVPSPRPRFPSWLGPALWFVAMAAAMIAPALRSPTERAAERIERDGAKV